MKKKTEVEKEKAVKEDFIGKGKGNILDDLIEGNVVHFVLSDGPSAGEHRPAIIVRVWRLKNEAGEVISPSNGLCQLQVFTDSDPGGNFNDRLHPVEWKTSIVYDESGKPGTWHWIERE